MRGTRIGLTVTGGRIRGTKTRKYSTGWTWSGTSGDSRRPSPVKSVVGLSFRNANRSLTIEGLSITLAKGGKVPQSKSE